jgi:hypothetical protein
MSSAWAWWSSAARLPSDRAGTPRGPGEPASSSAAPSGLANRLTEPAAQPQRHPSEQTSPFGAADPWSPAHRPGPLPPARRCTTSPSTPTFPKVYNPAETGLPSSSRDQAGSDAAGLAARHAAARGETRCSLGPGWTTGRAACAGEVPSATPLQQSEDGERRVPANRAARLMAGRSATLPSARLHGKSYLLSCGAFSRLRRGSNVS